MENKLRIAIGNDHTAFEFRKPIIAYLKKEGYEIIDLGTPDCQPVDYPNFGMLVARTISDQKADFGIAICGTGIGISIAANRVANARCALCYEEETVRLARIHNNANILALGARIIAPEKAIELIKIFLATKASDEPRHKARIEELK